jgi:hypothetical protein
VEARFGFCTVMFHVKHFHAGASGCFT